MLQRNNSIPSALSSDRVQNTERILQKHQYPGRVGIQQRILPTYRATFLDALAASCQGGLEVFAGKPRSMEFVDTTERLHVARHAPAQNQHFFSPGSPLYSCRQKGLQQWLETWQPDLLVAEANPRFFSTRSAVDWMHQHGKPVVGWGLGIPKMWNDWRKPLEVWRSHSWKRFLLRFDALVVYSTSGAEQYRQIGFPADRIVVARNAVAPRPTQPPVERPMIASGPPRLLFVGRLQARKRIDLLLRVCAALPQSLQPALTVVGDGPERSQLEELARVVYPRAVFPGARRGAELESYFAEADLFVLPGTGGLAIQEAMAYALPVLVAEADGTQSNLVHPGSGWLVPSGDEQALLHTLQTALTDIPTLRRMGAEAYRIVAEEVNLETMVESFLYAFQIVSAPRKTAPLSAVETPHRIAA